MPTRHLPRRQVARTSGWWLSKPRRECFSADRGMQCVMCLAEFVRGERYHDAGNGLRAHVGCVSLGGERRG